jgi:AcrR family transcriptional regulator
VTARKKHSEDEAGTHQKPAPRGAKAGKKAGKSQKPLARTARLQSGALPTSPTDLPPTPKKLLEAARVVFEKHGYAGLKLEAIAEESGLAHSLIRYHFGGKDGLVGVLIDWVLFDTYTAMHRGFISLPPEDVESRLTWMSLGLRRLLRDPVSYQLYLDLVVAALHDENIRPKLADSFVGQRRLISEAVETNSTQPSRERIEALSAIVVAFSDGLAMQYLADPENVDLDRIFEIWDEMIENASHPREGADSSR